MPEKRSIFGAVGALAAVAAVVLIPMAHAADAALRLELERVAQRRIFFGHQSVGANLLDGLKGLAASAGVDLRVAEAQIANGEAPGMLRHAWVGENGNPLQKLQAFEQLIEREPRASDMAFVKFCYLDITAQTDVKGLFGRYRDTIARLRQRHPGTTFVHVTAPLTEIQGGLKAFVKRLLGRAPYGAMENQRREEYNALLRKEYLGREPLFDLAKVESTDPEGNAVRSEWNGNIMPALAQAYTEDGHHLNEVGRLRAARELIQVLAAASHPRQLSKGPPR